MKNEGVMLAEFNRCETMATDASGDSQAVAESGWREWAFLVVTVGLLGYGSYLAWNAWSRLVPALVNPGSLDFVVISLAIQVVAPLLPPLAYLAVWLSSRREASWFLGAGVLCVLGLLTAAIEVCAHALR